MTLKETLDADLKAAIIDKNNSVRDSIRVIKSEIQREEKNTLKEFVDADIIQVIRKSIKNLETINSDESKAEILILEKYIPKLMSEQDIDSAIKLIIIEHGYSGPKDMGKIMSAFSAKHKGMAYGKLVSEIVKKNLN